MSGQKKERGSSGIERVVASVLDSVVKPLTGSRAAAAISRLVGTWADRQTAKQERKMVLEDIEGDVERRILEMGSEAKLAEAKRRVGAILEREEERQINRERVAQLALEYLPHEKSEETEETFEPVDEDWLNYFGDYAEKATTDKMRELWAKILAGEIRKPGKFSRRTLRFVAELDSKIAETLQMHAKKCFDGFHIMRPNPLEGGLLAELSFLEDVELLNHVSGFLHLRVKPDENGNIIFPPHRIAVGNFVIIAEGNTEIQLEVMKLTRTALEIVTILPPINQLEVLTEVATVFSKHYSEVKICQITEIKKTSFSWALTKSF